MSRKIKTLKTKHISYMKLNLLTLFIVRTSLLVVSCSFLFVTANCQQLTNKEQRTTNNELLVELQPETNVAEFFYNFEKKFANTTHSTVSNSFNIYKISDKYQVVNNKYQRINDSISELSLITYHLSLNKDVVAVCNNSITSPRGTTPNDSLYNQQYYLSKTSVPQLWDITQGGTTACGDTIVTAIIDQGFDTKIKDFIGNLYQNKLEIPNNGIDDDGNGYVDDYQGYNFYTMNDNFDKTQFDNTQNHGNECAGIIGARGNNISGIAGINWRAKMLLLAASNSVEYIIGAYDYAYKLRKLYNDTKGAQGAFVAVTSCSLGIDKGRPENNLPWCNVYDKLGSVGIINIVAATNAMGDLNTIGDVPGLCNSNYLIVVHSTDSNDKLANTSPTSTNFIGLAAPGTDILTTEPLKYIPQYDFVGGNSFAAPQVAGVATLLYSINDSRLCPKNFVSPSDAALKIKNAIYNGVDKIPSLAFANKTGGRLNAFNSYKALQTLLPTSETPVTTDELRITPACGMCTISTTAGISGRNSKRVALDDVAPNDNSHISRSR